MSLKLTTKQMLFITRMTENQEQAEWGFEILLKRDDFAEFFDHLIEANLFSPEYNSGPIPAEDPGFFRIPYWKALDYLEAVAKLSGENNDLNLAQKIMEIIRSVSTNCEPDCKSHDNYHTYRKFAEILGLVPTTSITTKDLDLIPIWLNSEYDRGLAARALDRGALKSLLASEIPGDWQKACAILQHCTAILWVDEKGLGKGRKKPVSVVQDYWLKELIKNHASMFGIKAGREASQIFRNRVSEVFGQEYGDIPTYLSRPAVEDHPQNHSWDGVVNCVIEGLRDVIISWLDNEPENAAAFVAAMFEDENEMVRRVGIFALNQRWSVLKSLYLDILNADLFNSRNIHELYQLLKTRFNEFKETDKTATIQIISKLPLQQKHDDPIRLLKHTQRNWLSAIIGKGSETADNWFRELNADENLGKLSKHPDFHTFMESWSGPGPSPYSAQELLAFAEDGSLIDRLNDFHQPNTWRGTSTSALVKSLEESIGLNPQLFFHLIPNFIDSKRPYQYGLISGFKRLWDTPKEKQPNIDWNAIWEVLIEFFEHLIGDPVFWIEDIDQNQDLTPTREWIPPIIAEFIDTGTKKDNKAFSTKLLPRSFSLINILLEKSEAVEVASDDAMTQAINSPKGKAIEALFSYTLRVCRVSDKENGGHVGAWEGIKPIFDAELLKCKNDNYEFSTLAAAYLTNIEYISREWLDDCVDMIFPQKFADNFKCAIDGLSYAPATRSIYTMLIKHAVVDMALNLDLNRRQARERLIERIALAYLWGDEELDSPRFKYMFSYDRYDDLDDAIRFFWSIRGQELTNEQVEKIICFWKECIDWAQTLEETPKSLLSNLSLLICYITTISDREFNLLMAVAPYINVGYNADYFIEDLDRLTDQDPEKVSSVLGRVFDGYVPNYDYKDHLKKLLIKLAENGRRDDVLVYADRIRNLSGIDQLFKQLTGRDDKM